MLLLWAAALFLPPPARAGRAEETYVCVWESGMTRESYASAYAGLAGAGQNGVLLRRAGEEGVIAPTAAYLELYALLEEGSLERLLSASVQGVTRIERAALRRTYSARRWYADEWFAWTGEGFGRTSPPEHEVHTLTVFSGMPSAQTLARIGTERLIVRGEVPLSAADLVGTRIAELEMPAPYLVTDGVVLLDAAGGRRIVCALPVCETLVLPDADYADAGALLACSRLREVSIPFAGSARRSSSGAFDGTFARLFSDGEEFFVPSSLRRVTVRGGELCAFAFYACPGVEEVDCCAVAAEGVSRTAFSGMEGLRRLHCPRADLILTGDFSRETLACGCTLYVRAA